MKAFAELPDRLAYQRSRNAKLELIKRYVAEAPDPDCGYAIAAVTGGLEFRYAQGRSGAWSGHGAGRSRPV